MDVAAKAISTLTSQVENGQKLTEEKIIACVSDYYSLTPSQLTGKIRTSRIAMARHIAMYLDREMLDTPFIKIGETNGVKKVENSLKNDPDMIAAISDLKSKLS